MNKDFDYDDIPVGYYDDVYQKSRGIQSKWHHMKFAHFRKVLNSPTSHLDLACGSGTFLGSLDESRSLQVGIDISAAQVHQARLRYNRPNRAFVHSDTTKLPFQEGKFDLVSAIELIEHLPQPSAEKTLREAFRVLRPGGTLMLSTPNYRSLIRVIEPMIGWFGDVSYSNQHINKYHNKRLSDTLKDSGFENISVHAFMLFAPFFAFLGWDFPEKLSRLEPQLLTNRYGLLLYAFAQKPK